MIDCSWGRGELAYGYKSVSVYICGVRDAQYSFMYTISPTLFFSFDD